MKLKRAPFLAALIGVALALSSCSDDHPQKAEQQSSSLSPPPPPAPSGTGQQRRIASSHSFTLRMAGADIDTAQRRHIETCQKLSCTVLSSQVTRNDVTWANGALSVRVAPDAFEAFTKALAEPPARIISHAETAEDKTIAVLDLQARLTAKKALRDRLEILAKEPGKASLADLLAVQKELANVQGEIEAATAQYTYLTTLTDTIKIDVSYVTDPARTEISAFEPITQAIDKARFTFAHSVGAVITFVIGFLPWIPLLALAIWGVPRLWRRLRRRT